MLENLWVSLFQRKENLAAYISILDSCVLPTFWQQSGEELPTVCV